MTKAEQLTGNIGDLDRAAMAEAQKCLDGLTKPPGSLGRLEDLAKQIVGITGEPAPHIRDKVVFTLAADHGVWAEKVTGYPQAVTAQMVYNFLRGGAGINVMARHAGVRVVVVDMGVKEKIELRSADCGVRNEDTGEFKDRKIGPGTRNFAEGPAMTREEAGRAVETGIELAEEAAAAGVDIIGLGEMGIANTTASAAIAAAVTGRSVEELTGRGTGIDDTMRRHKVDVISRSLTRHKPNGRDGWDVLSKVGGFEIGGLAGIILGCAHERIPVVLDGFITGAAALIAGCIEPRSVPYMIASHCSVEPGHRRILEHLGLSPLLDLNFRLGEGTGAVLGIGLAELSIKILTEMATFESAGVSGKA